LRQLPGHWLLAWLFAWCELPVYRTGFLLETDNKMGQLPKSFIRPQANTPSGVWSWTSTDRSLFEGIPPQRFMKLPGLFSEEHVPGASDGCPRSYS
jgi:hypothetical protein